MYFSISGGDETWFTLDAERDSALGEALLPAARAERQHRRCDREWGER